jgi:hypothetical protein
VKFRLASCLNDDLVLPWSSEISFAITGKDVMIFCKWEMCVANVALSNAGGGELTRVRIYGGMLVYEWR